MTRGMASHSGCLFAAAGDRNSAQINGSAESDSERAFLIGVAGGTASGKVIVSFFSMHHNMLSDSYTVK